MVCPLEPIRLGARGAERLTEGDLVDEYERPEDDLVIPPDRDDRLCDPFLESLAMAEPAVNAMQSPITTQPSSARRPTATPSLWLKRTYMAFPPLVPAMMFV